MNSSAHLWLELPENVQNCEECYPPFPHIYYFIMILFFVVLCFFLRCNSVWKRTCVSSHLGLFLKAK